MMYLESFSMVINIRNYTEKNGRERMNNMEESVRRRIIRKIKKK